MLNQTFSSGKKKELVNSAQNIAEINTNTKLMPILSIIIILTTIAIIIIIINLSRGLIKIRKEEDWSRQHISRKRPVYATWMVHVRIDGPQIARFVGGGLTMVTCLIYLLKLATNKKIKIAFPHKLVIHICITSMIYCVFQILACLQFQDKIVNETRFFLRIIGLLG